MGKIGRGSVKMIKENNCHNKDEVDLRELYAELKKNVRLISLITLLFILSAIIYNFIILKPIYQYSMFLRLPDNVIVSQINTYVEILKNDIKPGGILIDVRRLQESSLLVCTFEAGSVDEVLKESNAVLPGMAEKINKIIYETDRQRFHNEVVKDIQEDIAMIRDKVIDTNSNFDEINKRLKYITNKLELTEENYIFPKVEIIKGRDISHTPIQPNKKKNIGISFLLGILLSCSYVIGRYLFSNSTENEK